MALNEIQLPTKSVFYQSIQNAATQMDALISKWRMISEFVENVGTSDLDAMGVENTGTTRQDLIDFKVAINEIIALYDGASVTPTKSPAAVIDKIRAICN